MWENLQIIRMLSKHLPNESSKRLVLITGARQTGKTTLVRKKYQDLAYYNLDAIEYRDQLTRISTFRWADDVGNAVIDEIQKEPVLFDKIKYAFDDGTLNFSVLTVSSQILLLKKVKETLAGRIILYELFPLTLSELIDPFNKNQQPILLESLIFEKDINEILNRLNAVIIGEKADHYKNAENWLNYWGGMAPTIHLTNDREKQYWLKDYAIAYLERDLSDLASLNDLKPFRKFQQISALRAANLISFTELARDAGISIETSRRYLEYLRISYQTFLLQPYYRNITSSVVKTPKLYWFDNGLLRHLSGFGFQIDNGQLFENYVASEIIKYIRTNRLDIQLYFYRTRSGMEIDFILETHQGILAIEVKNRELVSAKDFTNLKRLKDATGKNFRSGIVIYKGNEIKNFGDDLWAIPSTRLFSW